jgi:raffinose/stachyose/melibiose transport system substrate-binding protein
MRKALLAVALTALVAFGANAQKVTLHLLVYGAATADAYNDLAAKYLAETGVTLDFDLHTNDQQTVLRAALNSGNYPDLFMTSAYADNLGYKDYTYDLTNEDFIKLLQPSTLSGVTLDGKVTGYPFSVQAYSFIYNKKVFRDAGITDQPKTIADYETLAKRLQAKGIQAFATGYKEWWVLPQTAWGVIAPSIQDVYGGYASFVDKMNKGTLKFSQIKEMSSMFDLLDLIKKYGGMKPLESDFNDQIALLASGKAGMIHQGDWAEPQILKINPNAELGQLLTPVAAGAAKAGVMMDSNITLRVAKDGQNVKAALAFLRWMVTSPTAKTWYSAQAQAMSAVKAPQTPPTIIDKESLALVSKGAPIYPWYYQRFPTGLEQGLGVVLQQYVTGQLNRQQTLAALDDTYAKAAAAQ